MTGLPAFSAPVTLVGGGEVGADDLRQARRHAPHVVAADSGAEHVLAAGLLPEAVIGDLDSISEQARRAIPSDRLFRIVEQDSSDFDKCLRLIDAPLLIAVGFTGARLDHTLAAFATISRKASPPTIILGAEDIAFRAPENLDLDLPAGLRLSLFPMGEARGVSTGLHWPIDGITFAPAGFNGISNRVSGPVGLRIEGPMIVILPRQALDGIFTQLLSQLRDA